MRFDSGLRWRALASVFLRQLDRLLGLWLIFFSSSPSAFRCCPLLQTCITVHRVSVGKRNYLRTYGADVIWLIRSRSNHEYGTGRGVIFSATRHLAAYLPLVVVSLLAQEKKLKYFYYDTALTRLCRCPLRTAMFEVGRSKSAYFAATPLYSGLQRG